MILAGAITGVAIQTAVAGSAIKSPAPAVSDPKIVAISSVAPYPVDALRRLQEGRATVRAEIDPQGRVKKCAVIVSSGSSSLDKASCDSVRGWQFAPALDGDGRGTKGTIEKSINWRLPFSAAERAARAGVSSDNPR